MENIEDPRELAWKALCRRLKCKWIAITAFGRPVPLDNNKRTFADIEVKDAFGKESLVYFDASKADALWAKHRKILCPSTEDVPEILACLLNDVESRNFILDGLLDEAKNGDVCVWEWKRTDERKDNHGKQWTVLKKGTTLESLLVEEDLAWKENA